MNKIKFENEKKFWLELETHLENKEEFKKSLKNEEAFNFSLKMYFTYKFSDIINNKIVFGYKGETFNVSSLESFELFGSTESVIYEIHSMDMFEELYQQWLRDEKINELLNE